jgi:hypothetical protein
MRASSNRLTCAAHRYANKPCHSLRDNKGASKLWPPRQINAQLDFSAAV